MSLPWCAAAVHSHEHGIVVFFVLVEQFLLCKVRDDLRCNEPLFDQIGILLYKRLENGKYKWPRDSDEARQITKQEFRWLMEGLSIEQKTAIRHARTGAVC